MNPSCPTDFKPLSAQRCVPDRADRAFTLVELLVVLATVGILTVWLLPALASSTQPGSAKSYQCLNNMRQMAVAWTLYAGDNHDCVVNNFGIAETTTEINNQTYRNWVNDIMDWTYVPGGDQMTNLNGITKAPFNSCLSGSVTCYKCPADNFLSKIQTLAGYKSRPRSYSMNAYFGAYNPTWSPTDWNIFFPSYRQFLKMSAVPSPASIYVMMEEHPDSINDGYFLNNANPNIAGWSAQNWNDVPGSNHAGSGGFAFADGHSEMHQWKSSVTKRPVKMQTLTLYPFSLDKTNAYADAQWLALHSSVPR
jgi:prepilin-type N-terminal cleavage/methylation domain-containing protein/prepilin-type processing-associated H-X9-DG protein